MIRSALPAFCLVVGLAAVQPVLAADATLHFVAAAQVDPTRLLPAPPSDASPAGRTELAELHAIEKDRTPAQFERAMSDDKTENATIFAEVLGPGFDLAKLPATAKMLGDVRNDEKVAAAMAKTYFKRNRPWIVDGALKPCATDDPPQTSYPSGHATMGYAFAVVLGQMVPDKAQALLARASEYAENRLVCGMHFRRDIAAGEVLGTVVALEMLKNSAFKAEVDAAAGELRAVKVAAN